MQQDKSSKKKRPPRTLRFDDLEQVKVIHRAADVLGMSFNTFVVRASHDAAKLVNAAKRDKRPTLGNRAGENLMAQSVAAAQTTV